MRVAFRDLHVLLYVTLKHTAEFDRSSVEPQFFSTELFSMLHTRTRTNKPGYSSTYMHFKNINKHFSSTVPYMLVGRVSSQTSLSVQRKYPFHECLVKLSVEFSGLQYVLTSVF